MRTKDASYAKKEIELTFQPHFNSFSNQLEDETAGWRHGLNGHGFGWTLGVGDGQGGLAFCGSWGRKESDTTERLN